MRPHSQAGVSDTEMLKLLLFGTIAISSVYLIGGWFYGVKEDRLARDRQIRGRITQQHGYYETHEVEIEERSLEYTK